MNIPGLDVSSSSLRDILRLERSLQHVAKKEKKKPNLIWQLHVLFESFRGSLSSLAVAVFLRPFLWSLLAFLICGNCLQTLQNVLQQMGNRITILGSIKHPTPTMAINLFMLYFNPYSVGAPASDDLSVFEKKEDMLFIHSI